ncbi:uncharacterized protein EI90DRAFT_3018793 [Cantharellus anzutake]|uniref:uncharacterized protein n=1 Tax=Cantharellus anzutake TaxID=1750568 RepID=UPI0019062A13|nr:uncharacterized protein EI90DRAFT_3018793 [Cantharellus anzutake]KAF8326065.1 hypothetical protein EI90DRAFT_3018793 [Cantharellus anzutake]
MHEFDVHRVNGGQTESARLKLNATRSGDGDITVPVPAIMRHGTERRRAGENSGVEKLTHQTKAACGAQSVVRDADASAKVCYNGWQINMTGNAAFELQIVQHIHSQMPQNNVSFVYVIKAVFYEGMTKKMESATLGPGIIGEVVTPKMTYEPLGADAEILGARHQTSMMPGRLNERT